jgi:hypothetical protein
MDIEFPGCLLQEILPCATEVINGLFFVAHYDQPFQMGFQGPQEVHLDSIGILKFIHE